MKGILFMLLAAVVVYVLATIVQAQAKRHGVYLYSSGKKDKKEEDHHLRLDYEFIRETLWSHIPTKIQNELLDDSFCFQNVQNLKQVDDILDMLSVTDLRKFNENIVWDLQIHHSCKDRSRAFGDAEQEKRYEINILSLEALKTLVDKTLEYKTT